MRNIARRIIGDLAERQNIDAYLIAFIAFAFALISLISDVVSVQLRWAVLLAGVGLLVYRVTLPVAAETAVDSLLNDRTSFDDLSLPARLRPAREVWLFAPSGINFLSGLICEVLRSGVLSSSAGSLRIVVLDPAESVSVELASHQLDDSLDFPLQSMSQALNATLLQLSTMAGWQVSGHFEYRLLGYNPGFSMVAVDPASKNGHVIVEFHGFHNESTSSRMHIELTRGQSERWFSYWTSQFDHIWRTARPPGSHRR